MLVMMDEVGGGEVSRCRVVDEDGWLVCSEMREGTSAWPRWPILRSKLVVIMRREMSLLTSKQGKRLGVE